MADIESRNVILIGSNSRLGGNICACDFATCYPNGRFQAWANKPSRFKPVTDADKCAKCAKCAELCQLGAISMDEDDLPQVDPEKCLGCGNCVVFCESEAKEMELVHPVEWIPDGDVHLFTPMAPR
nr:4Fe-4S binding protein [Adlercreutzia sp. ZJ473]